MFSGAVLRELEIRFKGNESGLNAAMSSVNSSLDAWSAKTRNAGAAMEVAFGAGAQAAIAFGLSFNALKEQAQIAFTTMLGSGELAKRFLDDLAAFAAKTPFEFPDLLVAAQRLVAMGFNARDVIPMLTAIGDAAAAMGASSATIDKLTLALGQMSAKGKVSAEEMKQIAETGIPVWQILADKIGKTIPEAMKLAEKGMIDGKKAVADIVDGLEHGTKNVAAFAGMMDKQSKTMIGLFSTLKDTAREVLGRVMEPLFNQVRDAMQKLVDVIPALMKWWEGLSDEVKNAALALTVVAAAGPPLVMAIGLIGSALSALLSPIGAVIAVLAVLTAAYASNLGGIRDAVNEFAGVVASIWTDHGNEMGRITSETWGAITEQVRDNFHRISEIIRAGTAVMQGDWKKAGQGLIETTLSFTVSMGDIIFNFTSRLLPKWLNNALISIRDFAIGAARAIAGIQGETLAFKADFKVPGLPGGEAIAQADKFLATVKQIPKVVGGAHKAIKEDLSNAYQLIADWLRQTGQAVEFSQAAFKRLPKEIRASLLDQANAFHENRIKVEAWAASLIAAFGGTVVEVHKAGAQIILRNKEIEKSFAELGGTIDRDLLIVNDAMMKFGSAQADASFKAMKAAQETNAAWQQSHDALVTTFEDLSHQIPDSFNLIVDSIVNKSGLLGDALLNVAIEVKGYVKDALDVIDTMPGKLGDSLRAGTRSIEQWIKFLDSSIKLIQRVFGEAQTGLAGVIESIVGAFKGMSKSAGESSEGLGGILGKIGGLFKKTGGEALSSVDKLKSAGGVFAEFGDEISQSSEETGGTVSKAFAMMTTAITAFASGASIAAATGSKAIGALGGAAMGALQGFASGGPVGAIVGGIAGLFGGLFGGGKSPLQKAQEAAELQKARDAVRQSQEAVLQAVEKTKQDWIATLDKARELLESIQFYTKVPKLSFKEFFADVGKLFANILVLAKQFAGLATADVKAVVKALKPAVEAVAELPEALNAINSHLKVPDIQFDKFFADAEALLERLGELYDEIPKKIRKHARKFQEQLGDALQVIPDLAGALAGIFDVRELSDAQLDVMKRSLEKLVQRLGEVAQSFEKSLVKLIGFFAEKIGPAISLLKEHVELVRSMVDLPMPSESDFASLFESLVKGLNMAIASALSVTEESLSFAVAVWNKAREVFEAVKSGIEVVKAIAEAKWPEATAWDAFLASIQTMLDTLTAGLASMLEARDVAAQIADAAREIADSVGAATSAMASTASAAAAGAGVVPASVTIPGIQSFASRALGSAGPAFAAPQGAAQYGDVTISVVQEGPTEGDLSSWERFKEYNKRFWRDLRGRAQMLGRDDLVPVFLTDF